MCPTCVLHRAACKQWGFVYVPIDKLYETLQETDSFLNFDPAQSNLTFVDKMIFFLLFFSDCPAKQRSVEYDDIRQQYCKPHL